jgi:hypothetical protein
VEGEWREESGGRVEGAEGALTGKKVSGRFAPCPFGDLTGSNSIRQKI